MNQVKPFLLLALKLFLVFIAMLVAFIVSALVIRTGIETPPNEATQAGIAVLVVSLINSLVLAYLILRSHWNGIKLFAAIVLVHFGVETFMTQIETLYFNNAIKMPMNVLANVVLLGLVRALVFAVLAVLILGKWRGTAAVGNSEELFASSQEWLKPLAFLALAYAVIYFIFGYFVAWQWAEARQYYTGSTAIQPFFTHLTNTFVSDPILPVFQILRGTMWAGLAFVIVWMMKNRATWEICLGVALAFAVILTSGVIFPNAFMPAMVRQAHFFELASSMLTFGMLAGWVWLRVTRGHR